MNDSPETNVANEEDDILSSFTVLDLAHFVQALAYFHHDLVAKGHDEDQFAEFTQSKVETLLEEAGAAYDRDLKESGTVNLPSFDNIRGAVREGSFIYLPDVHMTQGEGLTIAYTRTSRP